MPLTAQSPRRQGTTHPPHRLTTPGASIPRRTPPLEPSPRSNPRKNTRRLAAPLPPTSRIGKNQCAGDVHHLAQLFLGPHVFKPPHHTRQDKALPIIPMLPAKVADDSGRGPPCPPPCLLGVRAHGTDRIACEVPAMQEYLGEVLSPRVLTPTGASPQSTPGKPYFPTTEQSYITPLLWR